MYACMRLDEHTHTHTHTHTQLICIHTYTPGSGIHRRVCRCPFYKRDQGYTYGAPRRMSLGCLWCVCVCMCVCVCVCLCVFVCMCTPEAARMSMSHRCRYRHARYKYLAPHTHACTNTRRCLWYVRVRLCVYGSRHRGAVMALYRMDRRD